jgi:hypothetical protein
MVVFFPFGECNAGAKGDLSYLADIPWGRNLVVDGVVLAFAASAFCCVVEIKAELSLSLTIYTRRLSHHMIHLIFDSAENVRWFSEKAEEKGCRFYEDFENLESRMKLSCRNVFYIVKSGIICMSCQIKLYVDQIKNMTLK